ncbi:hypothetical protein KFU94_00285 [Chloroflexi bacterium TSY]|nr:hypothetical protein [Chloroflexi bacterium TSY]
MQRPQVDTDLWEYRVLNDLAVSSEDLSILLNPLGEEGWDLAGLQGSRIIMKRKLLESRRYEYQKLLNAAPILVGEDVDFLAFLNLLGKVGWEVGGIVAPVIVMKRLLPRGSE